MKREHIIGFVHDPTALNQSSLGELEDLLDAYPWFQTAHLLVAKNHHNIDSIKFHEVLRDTALYAGDRTVLYHLIHAPETRSGFLREEDQSTHTAGDESILQTEELVRKLPDIPPEAI